VAGRRSRFSIGAELALFPLLLAASAWIPACRGDRLPEDDGRNRELTAGRTIFERKCASCHGLTGDGKTVTAGRFPYANLLDGKWRGDGSVASIEQQIRHGRDPMPKFEGKLTDEEIRETALYVRDLANRAEGKR
jgi:mono/diheme cytochrome c family protein